MVERGRKIHEEKRGETRGGKGERRMFTGVPALGGGAMTVYRGSLARPPPPPPCLPRFLLVQFNSLPNDRRGLLSERLREQVR